MARKSTGQTGLPGQCDTSGRKLFSDDCPQRYTGPIERADGARPFNGYLWPTESWWAHREPGNRNWDSRWNFGIVHLWNGTFAIMGQLSAIERNNRRYRWEVKDGQLHRTNNFATRREAIRSAAADLLRTLRSARSWRSNDWIARDPVHWAAVVNWVLTTAHREADKSEPPFSLYREPPAPRVVPTGMPLFDHPATCVSPNAHNPPCASQNRFGETKAPVPLRGPGGEGTEGRVSNQARWRLMMSDPARDQSPPQAAPGDASPPVVVPAVSIDRIFAEMAQQSRTLTACIAVNKARLMPVLAAAGIATVEIFYCGEGDDGGIDEIQCHDADNQPVALPDARISIQSCNWNGDQISEHDHDLADGIEAFALDIIESRYAGWENNEGATGRIVFKVAGDSIELEHGTKAIHYDYAEF